MYCCPLAINLPTFSVCSVRDTDGVKFSSGVRCFGSDRNRSPSAFDDGVNEPSSSSAFCCCSFTEIIALCDLDFALTWPTKYCPALFDIQEKAVSQKMRQSKGYECMRLVSLCRTIVTTVSIVFS